MDLNPNLGAPSLTMGINVWLQMHGMSYVTIYNPAFMTSWSGIPLTNTKYVNTKALITRSDLHATSADFASDKKKSC